MVRPLVFLSIASLFTYAMRYLALKLLYIQLYFNVLTSNHRLATDFG